MGAKAPRAEAGPLVCGDDPRACAGAGIKYCPGFFTGDDAGTGTIASGGLGGRVQYGKAVGAPFGRGGRENQYSFDGGAGGETEAGCGAETGRGPANGGAKKEQQSGNEVCVYSAGEFYDGESLGGS